MLICDEIREILPQYIADGEPRQQSYRALQAHLISCPSCRDYALRLRVVEQALHAFPFVSPDPEMAGCIMRSVLAQKQAQEEWHLFPWDVWVPAIAFSLAIIVALMCLPANLLPVMNLTDLERNVVVEGTASSMSLQVSMDLFWALWIGISVIAAGIGLSLSIFHWNKANSKSLGRLETRVTDAAAKLWDFARRTR